ncbi:Retinol dehydrogenase 16 [Mortierella sp. GBA30]|nr:Retinol dehydrogenase 16 [Mortierella sp. GBA30]
MEPQPGQLLNWLASGVAINNWSSGTVEAYKSATIQMYDDKSLFVDQDFIQFFTALRSREIKHIKELNIDLTPTVGYKRKQGRNEDLPMMTLTQTLCSLLGVCGFLRANDILCIDLSNDRFHLDQITSVLPILLPKEKRGGKRICRNSTIQSHSDTFLCPVDAFTEYLRRIQDYEKDIPHPKDASIKYRPLIRDTRDLSKAIGTERISKHIYNISEKLSLPQGAKLPKACAIGSTAAIKQGARKDEVKLEHGLMIPITIEILHFASHHHVYNNMRQRPDVTHRGPKHFTPSPSDSSRGSARLFSQRGSVSMDSGSMAHQWQRLSAAGASEATMRLIMDSTLTPSTMAQNNLTDSKRLVVVVTGTTTGFGAEIVNELNKRGGFTVYATCTTSEGLRVYQGRESAHLRPVQVDVTKQNDVNRLRAKIEAECPQGLYCLVNNAGIATGSYIDLTTEDDFQRTIDVNYMGIVRSTKALLPSLRTFAKARHTNPEGKSLPRARIIGMSSVAGRANTNPGMIAYCSSRHAAEAFYDGIRVELAPWEIDVSMIEPGFAKTPILAKLTASFEEAWYRADETIRQMYGGSKFLEAVREEQRQINAVAMPSEWVTLQTVDAIQEVDGAERARVLVGKWQGRLVVRLLDFFPDWVTDLAYKGVMKAAGTIPRNPFLLNDLKQD